MILKYLLLTGYLNKGEDPVTIGKDLNLNPNTVIEMGKTISKVGCWEAFLAEKKSNTYSKEFKIK
ncbi:hypothetical protein [Dubosiella newyorkensis]|uniref:hypothetical protein n=1 Tax=Dubosiella newyorkensis TaxID=1862672 RepID=UPI003F66BC51